MPGLKLARLPERTPVRIAIGVTPELHRTLSEYAQVYREAYGQEESVADLIPFMLQSFLEGDRGFARAHRMRTRSPGTASPAAGD